MNAKVQTGTSAGAVRRSVAGQKSYVRAIERRFLALRESGLYLSPKDFAILLDWFEREVPSALVIEAIEGVFAKSAARSSAKKISSIAYCRRAVEEAWEERRSALLGPPSAAGSAPSNAFTREEVCAHLQRIAVETRAVAGTLRAAAGEPNGSARTTPGTQDAGRLDPPPEPDRGRDAPAPRVLAAEELDAASSSLEALGVSAAREAPIDLRALEETLVAFESEALRSLRSGATDLEIAAIENETRQSLEALTGTMSAKAREAMLRRSIEAALRRRFRLPRYSLFTMVR